mmetsp:Transcript_37964/g.62653  ORF Transcript_37964/g.62653 Transcript_37964/m.62653 type:complete len:233 (-) Transcript_37964:42-740(-)
MRLTSRARQVIAYAQFSQIIQEGIHHFSWRVRRGCSRISNGGHVQRRNVRKASPVRITFQIILCQWGAFHLQGEAIRAPNPEWVLWLRLHRLRLLRVAWCIAQDLVKLCVEINVVNANLTLGSARWTHWGQVGCLWPGDLWLWSEIHRALVQVGELKGVSRIASLWQVVHYGGSRSSTRARSVQAIELQRRQRVEEAVLHDFLCHGPPSRVQHKNLRKDCHCTARGARQHRL